MEDAWASGPLRAPGAPALPALPLAAALTLPTSPPSPRTRQREKECHDLMNNRTSTATATAPAPNPARCSVNWDGVHCWPETPAGSLAIQPCFDEFNGIHYDTSQNATKLCYSNGTWDNYSDYEHCSEIDIAESGIDPLGSEMAFVFFVGFCFSLLAIAVAIWIFLYFKDLRCLRNTIHTNLMATYICNDATWILSAVVQEYTENVALCSFLAVLMHYFYLTNFFWMFVEGLYLFLLVVATFTGEKVKLHIYIIIGWGVPGFIVGTWAIIKHFGKAAPPDNASESHPMVLLIKHCPWMAQDTYDWIHQAPVITVLSLNLVFLISIMWVLITKLQSANTAETQQYRKATKALLVLFPLLGITYVLTMRGPGGGLAGAVFRHIQAILLSLQGFTVALFYCFLNTEVQNTLRHRLGRWREARAVGGGRRYTLSGHSKDWSPRSRTESIRLGDLPYGGSLLGGAASGGGGGCSPYHKRESTASATTTTTLLGTTAGGGCASGNGRLPNGSSAAVSVRAAACPLLPATGEDAV